MRKKEYPYQNHSLEDMKGEQWEDIPGIIVDSQENIAVAKELSYMII